MEITSILEQRLTISKEATAPQMNSHFHLVIIHEVLFSAVTRSPLRRKSSSNTNGIATARPNGQPYKAPVANANVVNSVRRCLLVVEGSKANANASVLQYIENEDGKNADIHYVRNSVIELSEKHDAHPLKQSTFRR